MKYAYIVNLIVLSSLMSAGCGDGDQTEAPVVVELGIDHYMEPCRVPFADWCHRVDEGEGFAPTAHCVTDFEEYVWGKEYRVRAERREVNTEGLEDARCNVVYAVIEVVSETPVPQDTVFTLPALDGGFFETLETPDALTLIPYASGPSDLRVALKTSQTTLISQLGNTAFDLRVSHAAEGAGLVDAEIVGISSGCQEGELALEVPIVCGEPCYCPEFQPEEEGPTCNADGQVVCAGARWNGEGGIIADCADQGDDGFSDCSDA